MEAPTSAAPPSDDDASKLVYLMSRDKRLFSFDPEVPGRAAYRRWIPAALD
jgi:hypothetical protein